MSVEKNGLHMLAVDFGASSGRTVLGTYNGSRLAVEEIHRFSNDPVSLGGSLHWDFLRLFHEMLQGIRACKPFTAGAPASLAVDTWGVDYGLVDGKGRLLGNPYHYRDSRNEPAMRRVLNRIPEEELYRRTGIQTQSINTLFQLEAEGEAASRAGEDVRMLFMPDLFRYYLCGEISAEYTIASTSGLLDPQLRGWDEEVLALLPHPRAMFPSIVMPGTAAGSLRAALAEELQMSSFPVVAAASHDTASAVVSVPAQAGGSYAFISCGTWSLMGVETERPVITEQSRKLAFTNEGGADGRIRLQKNIMGLWLLQECRRYWELEGETLTFGDMQAMAAGEEAAAAYVDPEDPVFLAPGNMPERIRSRCRQTGQPVPQTKAQMIRCIVESLAMKFSQTLNEIEELLGRRLDAVHMVGGGIRNRLLCQLTANITGRCVIAGPVEATAIGSLLMQAKARGELHTRDEMRQVVLASFPPDLYSPEDTGRWQEAYARYRKINANPHHSERSVNGND
ncbi:rhamnulokinase [Paenibacillus chitinolyticus]